MKYKLKDKSLQKKLDDISSGAFLFSEALNEACEGISDFSLTACPLIRVSFGQTPGISHAYEVYFNPDQIEKAPEYNPYAWNRFPDVTPPEGIQMRCITQTGMGFMLHYMSGDWLDNRNDVYDEHGLDGSVVRFRPWED